MSILSFSKVSKSFAKEEILNNISFLVDKSDKIGLIGNNGSGKSTLLKIICGEMAEDEGTIYREKDLNIAYLDQSPSFDKDESIMDICLREFQEEIRMEKALENLSIEMEGQNGQDLEDSIHKYADLMEKFEKRDGYAYKSMVRGVLIGLGFSEEEFDTRVSSLSGGQKSRLHLASLLLRKPQLLLLDEPTNHLDMEATAYLETFLKKYDGAVIIVSHDRYFLDKVIDKTFHIENKTLHIYHTDYTEFVRRRKERLAALEKKYAKQQDEVAKQKEIIERFSNYGRDRYKKQAESRKKQLEKMDLIDKPSVEKTSFNLNFTPQVQSGMDVLDFHQVGKSFSGKKIFENISFDVKRGDRIGVIGANGIGKSTLIKMIPDQVQPDEGEVIIGSNVIYAYYDQAQDNLDETNLIIDELIDSQDHMSISAARTYLGAFNFKGDDAFKLVGDLSGGEKGRLSLLKLMLERPNLLLMDEPTNHLDIESKEILEEALNDYEGSFIIVSHDRYFLNKVASKIIHIQRDSATVYYGNYDYYLEKISQAKEDHEESDLTKTSLKKEKKKLEHSKKELRQLRASYNSLEKEIHEMEFRLEDLKEESYQPKVYNDYEKSSQIHDQIKKLEEKIEEMTMEWFDIGEKLED